MIVPSQSLPPLQHPKNGSRGDKHVSTLFLRSWSAGNAPSQTRKAARGLTGRMSGDEHPSLTKSHWRDVAPPLFTKEELGSSSGTAPPLDMATLLALFAFVGVVVRCPRAPGR